jgi:hypothetical protein
MKAIIEIDAKLTHQIQKAWEEAHASYYGTPHGAKEFPSPSWGLQLLFQDPPPYGYWCGLNIMSGVHAWITSAGNWAAITVSPEGNARLIIDSRRHGLPLGIFAAFSGLHYDRETRRYTDDQGALVARVVAYETMVPDSNPMERNLSPAPVFS